MKLQLIAKDTKPTLGFGGNAKVHNLATALLQDLEKVILESQAIEYIGGHTHGSGTAKELNPSTASHSNGSARFSRHWRRKSSSKACTLGRTATFALSPNQGSIFISSRKTNPSFRSANSADWRRTKGAWKCWRPFWPRTPCGKEPKAQRFHSSRHQTRCCRLANGPLTNWRKRASKGLEDYVEMVHHWSEFPTEPEPEPAGGEREVEGGGVRV